MPVTVSSGSGSCGAALVVAVRILFLSRRVGGLFAGYGTYLMAPFFFCTSRMLLRNWDTGTCCIRNLPYIPVIN
ncbi:predicted protein [Histoplasma mississippiense (nom. inval.)]|uniref:predicted protein n=1 Tax=Ajellomyces capsulatus (strain NAm1 / WU24) TaxID=2059318 RepID=UPI000157D1B7|nr:predicted protein [Histoplasma mississippiense (nom. inval.)]EDN04337.1 predicted protein [Histoplasma mississippiense (nom. inval.)]